MLIIKRCLSSGNDTQAPKNKHHFNRSLSLLGTLSSNNCGVTSSRSRSFDVSSLIGLSPNDTGRSQRSGSCSPPTSQLTSQPTSQPNPSPNVSVGPPGPPAPPSASAAAAAVAAAAAAAGGASGGPPVAPSGLYPFLLHPGLYQHLITGMYYF